MCTLELIILDLNTQLGIYAHVELIIFSIFGSVLFSVCYIASELMKHLMSDPDSWKAYEDLQKQERHKEIDYDMCVKVAALCHDLG